MKKRRVLIIAVIFIVAIVIGALFFIRKSNQEKAFRQNLESATLKVCDCLNERTELISFTYDEYQAIGTAAGRSVTSVEEAMQTQVIRVTIVEKFSALMQNEQYDELLDVLWYLGQNDFYFSLEENNFDIVFTDEDIDRLTAFVINNNSGTVVTGNTTSYLYKSRTMVFDYNGKFCGVRDDANEVLILVTGEDFWRTDLFRSSYCFRMGDRFCQENLIYEAPVERETDEEYSFSDYLKENDPELYDAIVDRYNSLQP